MTVGELIKATFQKTPEMPDYLTPMSNPINGKIIRREKEQATEEKKEFTIWDIMKERPHNAMCNHMYLILMRIFKKNCPGRELPESVVFIMEFAFRNVMDMIMPISNRDEYLDLGATQDETDGQEEWTRSCLFPIMTSIWIWGLPKMKLMDRRSGTLNRRSAPASSLWLLRS
jgi:hypothetical protein